MSDTQVTSATAEYERGEHVWTINLRTVPGHHTRGETDPATLPLHILEHLQAWAADGLDELKAAAAGFEYGGDAETTEGQTK